MCQLELLLYKLNDSLNYQGTKDYQLGDLQPYYSTYVRCLDEYKTFLELELNKEKVKSLRQQQNDYSLYYKSLTRQKVIKEELKLSKDQFKRDQKLFNNQVYSLAEFEMAQKTYLKEKLALENVQTTLANTSIQINRLEQLVNEVLINDRNEKAIKEAAVEEAYLNLKSRIEAWRQTYLITTPVVGMVTYSKIWSQNQNVQLNDIIATVVLQKETKITGKLEIPSPGVGKIKTGQVVNIKLDNYPYAEFGLLRSSLKNISPVPFDTPNGAIYIGDINMPQKLISNYGKPITFTHQMEGNAEIITDDMRLLIRLFNPIKALWNEKVKESTVTIKESIIPHKA